MLTRLDYQGVGKYSTEEGRERSRNRWVETQVRQRRNLWWSWHWVTVTLCLNDRHGTGIASNLSHKAWQPVCTGLPPRRSAGSAYLQHLHTRHKFNFAGGGNRMSKRREEGWVEEGWRISEGRKVDRGGREGQGGGKREGRPVVKQV